MMIDWLSELKYRCIKRFLPVSALVAAACNPLPTSFEQIEENRVRTIDFIYRNVADTTLCEASPGDTMEVIALFAGEKVREIALTASFDVQVSMYGKVASFNERPLDYMITRTTLQDSGTTDADTFAFRFEVPRDMLKTSSFLPEHEWVNVLPAEMRSAIPSSIALLSKTEIITMLERFLEMEGPDEVPGNDTAATPAGAMDDSLSSIYHSQFLPAAATILQLFGAHIKLMALVNGSYEITSFCTVRYHRCFRHLDTAVICNENPVITRMGIYRVQQNNLSYFDPAIHTQSYERIVLFDADAGINLSGYTLAVEKDESYFLFAQSDSPQQTISVSGVPVTETHLFEWFFQQDFTGADTVELKERLSLYNTSDGPIVPLIPAATEAVDQCAVWVQVRDEAPGVRMYPAGSSVYSTRVFFTYSQDYLKDSRRLR